MSADKPALYWMDPGFERAVVYYCCSSPAFWASVGHAVDPECLGLAESRHAVRAARLVAKDSAGRGPASVTIVLQRLRRQMEDGKVTYEDCLAVGDMFLTLEEDPPPAEAAVVAELAPVLKKRTRAAAVRKAMEEFQHDTDDMDEDGVPFVETVKLIESAKKLGAPAVAQDVGLRLGDDSAYAAMNEQRHVERLSTGIEDLDILLKGGPRRGGFQLFLGGTNAGKSMALVHRVGRAMRLGCFSALATLELSREEQLARVKANLTGVTIDDILDDPECVKPYLSKMALGVCRVQAFTSGVTTMSDLREWVDLIEREEGKLRGVERVPLDLLSIDYGDLVGVPVMLSGRNSDSNQGYTVGQHVFGAMRIYAEGDVTHPEGGHPGGPIWVDTASAATRAKDKRKKLTTDDVADSLHKVRRATLVVSVNPEESGIVFFVAKNTHGKAQFSVGPLPPDFDCGRIAPVMESAL